MLSFFKHDYVRGLRTDSFGGLRVATFSWVEKGDPDKGYVEINTPQVVVLSEQRSVNFNITYQEAVSMSNRCLSDMTDYSARRGSDIRGH